MKNSCVTTSLPSDRRARTFESVRPLGRIILTSVLLATPVFADTIVLTLDEQTIPAEIQCGETWNEAAERVSAAVDRLNEAHGSGDIIVVAHFGAILTQVQRATGISAIQTFGHRIDNLSVTQIALPGKVPTLPTRS